MAVSVRVHCDRAGISCERLAQQSGLDPKRVEAIFQGRWTPSESERDRIAQALGVPREEIAWGHSACVEHFYGPG